MTEISTEGEPTPEEMFEPREGELVEASKYDGPGIQPAVQAPSDPIVAQEMEFVSGDLNTDEPIGADPEDSGVKLLKSIFGDPDPEDDGPHVIEQNPDVAEARVMDPEEVLTPPQVSNA